MSLINLLDKFLVCGTFVLRTGKWEKDFSKESHHQDLSYVRIHMNEKSRQITTLNNVVFSFLFPSGSEIRISGDTADKSGVPRGKFSSFLVRPYGKVVRFFLYEQNISEKIRDLSRRGLAHARDAQYRTFSLEYYNLA